MINKRQSKAKQLERGVVAQRYFMVKILRAGQGYIGLYRAGIHRTVQGRDTSDCTGQGYIGLYRAGIYRTVQGRDTSDCTGQGYIGLYRAGIHRTVQGRDTSDCIGQGQGRE